MYPYAVKNYLSRISGPHLDRIDMQIEVNPVPGERLLNKEREESSSAIRERVAAARIIQQERFGGMYNVNTKMVTRDSRSFAKQGSKSKGYSPVS